MDSRLLFTLLIALVAAERVVELVIAERNARAALDAGGTESGQAHYRVMRLLHASFLVAAPLEVWSLDRAFLPWLGWPMLAIVAATMSLRYWVVATLGPRWNTRVIVVPSWEPAVGGPYRFVRHPNYVAVILELAALPLVHTAWITAVVYSVANAWLLTVRIRVEERALAAWSGYDQALGTRPRLVGLASDSGAGRPPTGSEEVS